MIEKKETVPRTTCLVVEQGDNRNNNNNNNNHIHNSITIILIIITITSRRSREIGGSERAPWSGRFVPAGRRPVTPVALLLRLLLLPARA